MRVASLGGLLVGITDIGREGEVLRGGGVAANEDGPSFAMDAEFQWWTGELAQARSQASWDSQA